MFTCFGLTGFLTFNFTGVASHESFSFESGFVVGVDFDESACDSETQGLGLAFEATAVEVDFDIVFFSNIQFCKRLLNDILKNRTREINFKVTTIDGDFAGTFAYVNASDSSLTTT